MRKSLYSPSGGNNSGSLPVALDSASFLIGIYDTSGIAYTSATTITLSGSYPAIADDKQIKWVLVQKSTGETNFYFQGKSGVVFTHFLFLIIIY